LKNKKHRAGSADRPETEMGLSMMRQATAGTDDRVAKPSLFSSTTKQGETPVMTATDTTEGQRELWNRVRARIKTAVGVDVFTSWFAALELEEVVDDVVHLSAPTRFLCSWVLSNYSDLLLETFRQDFDNVARVQVTLRVNGQARPRLTPAVVEAAPQTGETTAAPRSRLPHA
jgi:chromosomal replication initiator protein